MLYSSVLSPELLEKAAAASFISLQSQISKMLDSITCTTVPYKYLYKMDKEIASNWLRLWVDANHPSSQNCIIDRSDNVRNGMHHVMEKIIEEAIKTTDPDIIGISLMLDAEDEENSEGICNIDHEAASSYTIHTDVLPKPFLINANINSAITAMLDIVQPKNADVNEDETYDKVVPHEKYATC
jgi:hypothetical protein